MMGAEQQSWPTEHDDPNGSFSHPVAHPVASNDPRQSDLADAIQPPTGLANDGAHTGTTLRPGRRTRRVDITAIETRLSDRDRAILQSVAEHQFLTGGQISALHFHGHTAASGPRIARRVLARLRGMRLLGTLERRVGGIRAGSDGLVHYIDVVGDQLLRGRSGRTARRSREPSARFLEHRLAIADAHIRLIEAHRSGDLALMECTIEPASWRRYNGVGGAQLTLKPDLYAETGAGHGLVRAWFIEIDLGTESIPTLLRKCRDYEAYRRSGIEQDRSGGFPIVIWSVTHRNADKAKDRREALRAAIDADRALPPQLFQVVAPQQLSSALKQGAKQ